MITKIQKTIIKIIKFKYVFLLEYCTRHNYNDIDIYNKYNIINLRLGWKCTGHAKRITPLSRIRNKNQTLVISCIFFLNKIVRNIKMKLIPEIRVNLLDSLSVKGDSRRKLEGRSRRNVRATVKWTTRKRKPETGKPEASYLRANELDLNIKRREQGRESCDPDGHQEDWRRVKAKWAEEEREERRQRGRFIFAVSLRSLTSTGIATPPGALLTKHENLDARFTSPNYKHVCANG